MLKEDYKDDMFDGARKYSLITNDDKTVSLIDVTEYTQIGDLFGGNDANETNKVVNKHTKKRELSLPESGWSNTYPYSQTVSAPGVTPDDDIKIIGVVHKKGNTETQDKVIDKAAGQLMYNPDGVGNGTITFLSKKKLTTSIVVITEGG